MRAAQRADLGLSRVDCGPEQRCPIFSHDVLGVERWSEGRAAGKTEPAFGWRRLGVLCRL